MKSKLRTTAGKIYRNAIQVPAFRRPRGDSFDILDVAFFKAAMESAAFYEENMLTATAFDNHLALLTHAVGFAPKQGLILEFGVATGRTIRHIATQVDRQVNGFDSFEGLPESWRTGYPKGAFQQALPEVPVNVTLHKGLFSSSLPTFLSETAESAAFIHVDCDLYSSTACILSELASRIVKGTVIVFDEYFNYPGWKQHEHRAWDEFVQRTGVSFIYDSFVRGHQQVCIRVTG